MNIIQTMAAPTPNGHYSQAVVANGLIFLSAQLPIVPGTNGSIPDGIEAQARQALYNLRAILEASGAGLAHVVSASIYVTDIEDWPRVDSVWAEVFGAWRPARGVFAIDTLHLGASIAIQLIAAASGTAGSARRSSFPLAVNGKLSMMIKSLGIICDVGRSTS